MTVTVRNLFSGRMKGEIASPRPFKWLRKRPLGNPTWATAEGTHPISEEIMPWKRLTGEFAVGLSTADLEHGADQLVNLVKKSRRILELHDDWDHEGGQGYVEATWRRSMALLFAFLSLGEDESQPIELPDISPADHGSIDLHWKNSRRELLINVPALGEEPVTYYGENANHDSLAGAISSDQMRLILVRWLVSQ
jgi:hypothetical protein